MSWGSSEQQKLLWCSLTECQTLTPLVTLPRGPASPFQDFSDQGTRGCNVAPTAQGDKPSGTETELPGSGDPWKTDRHQNLPAQGEKWMLCGRSAGCSASKRGQKYRSRLQWHWKAQAATQTHVNCPPQSCGRVLGRGGLTPTRFSSPIPISAGCYSVPLYINWLCVSGVGREGEPGEF